PPAALAMVDPLKWEHVVPFTYYSEWVHQQFRQGTLGPLPGDTKKPTTPPTKDEVQARYDHYKEVATAKMKRDFVHAHSGEQWFREKYFPGEREIVRQKIVEYRKPRWEEWKSHLERGAFDNLNTDGKKKEDVQDGDDGEDAVVPAALDAEFRDEAIYKPTLLIKTISPTVSRNQLEEVCLCSAIEGFSFISLSDPNPLKKYHRIGFILLNQDAPIPDQTTIDNLGERKIHDESHGDFTCHIGIHTAPKELKRKILNSSMSQPENLKKQAKYTEKVARKFEEELGEGFGGWDLISERVKMLMDRQKAEEMEEEAEEGEDSEDESDDVDTLKKTIDIGVEYLRRVFSFCLYCVTEADSIHELTRKCPGGHTRRPPPGSDANVDPRSINWIRVWEEKVQLFADPSSADLKKLGGKSVYDTVEEEMQKNCKIEEEGKYRCKVQTCSKLFKGEGFWRKHVEKRHKDWIEKIELEAQLINNYALDPSRVQPPKQPDMPMGQAPRSFPMVAQMPVGQPMFPYFAGPPAAYSGAPHLPPIPPPMDRRDSRGGPGPIRHRDARGGPGPNPGPGGNYRSQPYQNRRPPPRDERGPPPPPRDGDRRPPPPPGRSGPAPPAEAAGRSIRSYMDLDATSKDVKAEELDY
ncbi:hypothetical protein BJ508DRAFT_207943, partial [Ascobolus immersus RN42]